MSDSVKVPEFPETLARSASKLVNDALKTELSSSKLLWMYQRMSLIRQFEERLKWLVETGVPVGAVHYYIGQEAVAVGVCAALESDDWIASNHRGHGHCIAKGVEVAPMM